MKIGQIFQTTKKSDRRRLGAELMDDVLCIDCRGCRKIPDVRSSECLRCIVSNISQQGNASRIRLRTSRDLELFGPATDALCEMAILYQSMMPVGKNGCKKTCSECINSYQKVSEIIWSGFPDPNFDSARGRLGSFRTQNAECSACMQKTYRALDQAELGIENIRKKVSVEVARLGDI
ncbi:MAG: hypothetical protein LBJ20_02165 [Candidatus Methanoplasma sp.]|jgi:hypothetical protein|nr:hypothetical protein [Candidatus Methanoplasma sp.]